MMVKCEICGLEMKDRINGSHLKRRHNISLEEYLIQYPHAELGQYKCSDFKCEICGEITSGNSELKALHLKEHGIATVDEYNQEYCQQLCKCGCGSVTDYSFVRHTYNDYVEGHYDVWNKNLTKTDHPSIMKIAVKRKAHPQCIEAGKKLVQAGKEWGKDPANRKFKYDRTKEAILKKYGVENPFELQFVKDKIKKTSLDKYGFEYPMQNIDILEKSNKNRKKYDLYITREGIKCYLQGFDILGLKYLLTKYDECELRIAKKQVPKIKYYFDNKDRQYIPDFFIPKDNLIVEVKSDYTYELRKEQNEAKFKATNLAGYNLIMLVFDKNKKLIKIDERKLC